MNTLTIAIAKGRMGEKGVSFFDATPYEIVRNGDSRRLVFDDKSGTINFIFVKSADVVTYVERGIADLGIVGKDIILEENKDIYEILDLKFGTCRFAIAGHKDQFPLKKDGVLRIASTYPSYVESVFREREQKIEIIELGGSVELAPLMGLSDVIVDIVETGSTLRENGLVVLEELDSISGRLIANKVSYRFKYDAIQEIENVLQEKVALNTAKAK